MQPRKVLIVTMFKVGCSTIAGTLWDNGIEAIRTHDYDETLLSQHPPESFDYIITAIRDPYHQTISAYFQDITTDGYPFKYGTEDEVLATTPSDLVDHFLKFSWHDYDPLNLDLYQQMIQRHFEIDIYAEPFDRDRGWSIYSNTRGQKIIVVATDHLNEFLVEFMRTLGKTTFTRDQIVAYNTAKEKWYHQVYVQFIQCLEERGGRQLIRLPDRDHFISMSSNNPSQQNACSDVAGVVLASPSIKSPGPGLYGQRVYATSEPG
jgi:hypothetical protein